MFPKPAKGTTKKLRHRKYENGLKRWRDAVWARDGWLLYGKTCGTCKRCGSMVTRGVDGEVDHIKPRSTHPERRYEPSNGRIVCSVCNRYLKTHPLEREA